MNDATASEDRQARVIRSLLGRAPKLAAVYKTALRTLNDDADEGCEAARVSVVCHCMRELMLGLPAVLTDIDIPRPEPSSGALVGQLPDLLAKHPDLDLGADQDVVPVPKAVATHLDSLIKARTQEDGRNRANAAALVTGGIDEKHPAIKQWQDAYRFFVGWTHFDRNHAGDRELPSDEEIRRVVRVVEDVVDVRTTAFFDNVRALEDFLAEINAPVEESA